MDFQKAPVSHNDIAAGAAAAVTHCANNYSLEGPQVEPGASHFLDCLDLQMITTAQLQAAIPAPANYPTAGNIQRRELQELIEMGRLRDEPGMIGHMPCHPPTKEAQRERKPLSLFLGLRPQPFGAVINTARGTASPVIASGRELARYFEGETPGLSFQLALDFILSETPGFSPPRQAAIWAGLHVTIASALGAAWFYKWRGGAGIQYRLRPWECHNELDVLFDRVTNSTNSGDGPRRGFPFGVRPQHPPVPFKPGETVTPEAQVANLLPLSPAQPTPGTPRHPAYPSGHSTYSASAARYLGRFFPKWKEELEKMADNIGIARLWAGVHWRTDHTFGRHVGTTVAELVIDQMVSSNIFARDAAGDIAPPRVPTTDPTVVPNPCTGVNLAAACQP